MSKSSRLAVTSMENRGFEKLEIVVEASLGLTKTL